MSKITTAYFDFFKELSKNNHRDWFQSQKKRYENEVKEPFLALISEIVEKLHDSEPELSNIEAKNMLFRINKDIRFAKDKSPYKTHMAASISAGGTKDKTMPGHYLQLGHGSLMLAGGAYFMEKEMLYKVRQFINLHEARFTALANDEIFVSKFKNILGESNKRIAPEFKETFEKQPLIANTQWYWGVEIDPKIALEDNFSDFLCDYFKAGKPLNDFFKEAMYH